MRLNKTHMHWSVILENVLSFICFIVIFMLAILFSHIEDNDLNSFINGINLNVILLLIFIFLIAILIVWLISYFIYQRTYIWIDNNFNLESGKIFKKNICINLNDISTVTFRQNIIEKLLNTVNLKLELNSGVENMINKKLVFKLSSALKIKNLILNKEEEKEVNSLVSYTNTDILSHLFLSTNLIVLIISIVIVIISFGYTLNNFNFKNLILSIVVIMGLVIPYVWNFILKYTAYHNFKLWSEKDKIKISYGLFVNYYYEIPREKINAVIRCNTVQARIFKKSVLKIVNAGLGNEENEEEIICLYMDNKKIDMLEEKLFSDFKGNARKINQSKNSLITYLLNKIPLVFIVDIICMWFSKYLLLIDLLFVIWSLIQYKKKSIQISENAIILYDGFFTKTKTSIKFSKITKIQSEDKLIGSLYKLKYLSLYTIGPNTEYILNLGYYNSKIERKILDLYK